jgi:mono/diheme cytochrome c family protein
MMAAEDKLILRLFSGIVMALTLSCTAHKSPSKTETALANMAKDLVIPMEAEKRTNPLPVNDNVVQQGQRIYLQSCALCHSTDGHGGTNLGRSMNPPAMDLTSPHVQHWNDAELFWIIQNGVRLTGMPSWKSTISETDTWKLVSLIRNLPRLDAVGPAAAQPQGDLIAYGKTLYRQEGCFMCHQLDGEGGKVGPDLTVEGTRGRTNEWLVGHFKNPPAYTPGSMMPAFKNLTDVQLRALTEFLQHQNEHKR